ncbi:MAG: hypothetical protein L6Q37_15270 [Bdellovibrionaceae bacterium]|nr:hypothetical protein [Pseudobdellovibrionaceae bacterium]NUM58794.1 hypothetical protein [Pseudobdellovibrionaceae bacterium]
MTSKKNNNTTQPTPLYHGRKPMNRREFLASGTIPFAASMTLPSLLTLFARSGVAEAQELCKGSSSKMIPIVNVNLSGGAGLTAQWIPLTEGRELLQKYQKIGLGLSSQLALQVEKAFKNNAPFWSGSGFLAGLKTSNVANLAVNAMNNAHFVGMCQQSQNDSDTNKFSIAGLVDKAGLKGKILPPLGRFDNGVGVSNALALVSGTPPLIVNNADNIVNALGVADRLGTLNQNQKTALFKTISSLSDSQVRKVANYTGGSALNYLLGSATKDNTNLIENPSSLDINPLSNQAFAQVWGLNANTAKGSADYVHASLVYNAINGNAGSIGIELGGYDYHGSDRVTVTTPRDLAAGVVVGKILQSFHVMNSKGFIYVNTDGGVGAAASDTPGASFTADRGDAGAVYMIAYDPSNSTESSDSQLGHMKNNPDAEAADETFLVGGSPEVGAAAIFANYLSFNGMINKFSSLPETGRLFDSAQLEKIVKIHGKS